jgi:hypothetical protein
MISPLLFDFLGNDPWKGTESKQRELERQLGSVRNDKEKEKL